MDKNNYTLKRSLSVLLSLALAVTAFSACSSDNSSADVSVPDNGSVGTSASSVDVTPVVEGLSLSHTEHFYTEGIKVEVAAAEGVRAVYYTKDGSPPQSSDTRKEYTAPITLYGKNSGVMSHTLKVVAEYEDGSFSDVLTHTYFLGDKVFERFDTLVFSVSTDPYNLFDYEYGIFVPGKLRDDYIAANPGVEVIAPDPANYNMSGPESERPVYVEVFEPDGTCVISQNAGVRTFGGYSRAQDRKSMKLFARREYDEILNDFDYEFFPAVRTFYDGTAIDSYKRLVLRNNANDENFCYMRDELVASLAGETLLPDTQHARPCAVFLNGEYYGFYWLHEVYDDNRFADLYDTEDTEWAILKGGEQWMQEDDDEELNEVALADYYDMMNTFVGKDLTDDALFGELCSRMDVDNFMLYYAINILVGNEDWPSNNYKAYRYFGENGSPDDATDGRWRWLLYDSEFSLGLYDQQPSIDILGTLLGKTGDSAKQSPLMQTLLLRDDMKKKLANTLCDLISGEFSVQRFSEQIDYLSEIRENELTFAIENRRCSDWFTFGHLEDNMRKLREYTQQRYRYIYSQIESYLGGTEMYSLNVTPNENADIYFNSMVVESTDDAYSGSYYKPYSTTLTCDAALGYEFDCWEINGERVTEKTVSVSADSDVILHVKPVSGEHLEVTEFSAKGVDDYIIISNPYSNELSTAGLYISDNPDELKKLSLPNVTLRSGESFVIYCENYTAGEMKNVSGSIRADFNIKNTETLTLSTATGEVYFSMVIPKLQANNVYRFDTVAEKWIETAGHIDNA